MILDPKLTGQLPEVVAEGGYYGMQTFDQHLLKHLRAGRITFEEAMRTATSPHDFKLMVAAEGSLGQVSAPEPAAQPEPQMTAGLSAPSAPPPPAPSAPPPGVQY
jgi:twitching motility protein PilT